MPPVTAPTGILLATQAVAALCLFLAAYAFSQRRVRCAVEFAVFMLAVAVYAGGYAIELSRHDLAGIFPAIRIEYLGNVLIPVMWVSFSHRFATGKGLSRPVAVLLATIPLLTLGLVWTSPLHELFYVRPHVRTDGPFATFGFDRGPFYWLYAAFFQACILYGVVVLVRHALRSGRVHRKQSYMVVAASFVPWVAYAAYLLGLVPWGLDSGPFSGAAAGIFFGLALFRLGLFEVVPAARGQAIDSLRDGFLVTDPHGVLLDANAAATRLLGWKGLEIGEVLPTAEPGADLLLSLAVVGEGRAELRLSPAGAARRPNGREGCRYGREGGRHGRRARPSDRGFPYPGCGGGSRD